MDAIKGLMDFIDRAPTAFHAVAAIRAELEAAGYACLSERERWQLEPGGRYYLTRNGSSVIAFRVPEGGLTHFQIVASHSDSPAFKLKPNPARTSQGCAVLNVEKYGGMLMSTWLDRPLSIAGRLVVAEEDGLRTRLVNVDAPLAVIPNMPIHFNRSANDGVAWNAQVDMQPVYGMEGADYLQTVAEWAGVEPERVAGGDLFLYNRDRATRFGVDGAFISAPRLDDLECAYTSLRAFLAAKPTGHVDVFCVFDNEEVGSGTKQGADSTLLIETLRRIALALDGAPKALEAATKAFAPKAGTKADPQPDQPVDISGAKVTVSPASATYTGGAVEPAVTVTLGGKALKEGADYTVAYKGNVNVGTAVVTVTGKGAYSGSKQAAFEVVKAANPMTAKVAKKTVKAAKLKKKAVTVSKAVVVSKAQGKVSYAKVAKGSSKQLTVNAMDGKVTVKKGTKAGTYKVKVKVTAKGNANHKPGSKTVTVVVTVK